MGAGIGLLLLLGEGARAVVKLQRVALRFLEAQRGERFGEMMRQRRRTSILSPSGWSTRMRRAWRCILQLMPPVRNASGPPYLPSPTIGKPIAAMWTRS